MTVTIAWLRRDLRLSDQPVLHAALHQADEVIPLFILDPALLKSAYVGPERLAFLFDGLRALDADLQTHGSRLLVRRGEPRQVLASLLAETGCPAVFAQEDVSPYGRARDRRLADTLPLNLVHGLTVHPPAVIRKADGTPYTVFTPFSKAWKALPADLQPLPVPGQIRTPRDLQGEPVPDAPPLRAPVPFVAGEAEASRRLAAFAEGRKAAVYGYAEERNRLDLDGTSQLSPYLRFGMLSARQAVQAARAACDAAPDDRARRGAETWLNELIWREFYLSILYHFPIVRQTAFRAGLRDIPWDNDERAFQAWCDGLTGYPVVDAGMRQLRASGWMHNRARMVVASFLVKDLLIDWRWGERWFMRRLVDGDPASNNGGWQWTAGVGTDAAPYFRVFNPVLQGEKFDPQGTYVRRWVPELAQVPDKFIQRPWEMSPAAQKAARCLIGDDYPAPIVDPKAARERTLAAYKAAG